MSSTDFSDDIGMEQLDLICQEFCFADQSVKIERIKNLDDLVDRVSDDLFNEDERLPYWAELWPSAIGCSRFIAGNGELFKSKDILELGCGLGLTSINIAKQEPGSLLLTDYEKPALEMAARNFRLNKLAVPAMQLLDWRKPNLDGRYGLIVASDVLYEKRFFEPLLQLFNNFLTPGGTIIIAEPNRAVARPFFEKIDAGGFEHSYKVEPVVQDDKTISVFIHILRHKK